MRLRRAGPPGAVRPLASNNQPRNTPDKATRRYLSPTTSHIPSGPEKHTQLACHATNFDRTRRPHGDKRRGTRVQARGARYKGKSSLAPNYDTTHMRLEPNCATTHMRAHEARSTARYPPTNAIAIAVSATPCLPDHACTNGHSFGCNTTALAIGARAIQPLARKKMQCLPSYALHPPTFAHMIPTRGASALHTTCKFADNPPPTATACAPTQAVGQQ